MSEVVTPMQVERRLINLSKELDESQEDLGAAEHLYMRAKSAWEINSAKARMSIKARAIERGGKVTVSEVEDEALLRCQEELMALNTAEAIVKAARGNNQRIRTQIDIARSIGTSVRTGMGVVS